MCKIKTGIKMRVTPEQSRKVQEICFENSIYWLSGKHIGHLYEPFIYVTKNNKLVYTYKGTEDFFIKEDSEEISAELFIRTNGTCVEIEASTEDNNKGEIMKMVDKIKYYSPLNEGYTGGENNSQPPKKIDNIISAIIPPTKPQVSNTQISKDLLELIY